jgi:hypothetical protein
MIVYYAKQYHDASGFTMAGLSGEFDFLALTDFAISSTNIDDNVSVKINTLLRKKD